MGHHQNFIFAFFHFSFLIVFVVGSLVGLVFKLDAFLLQMLGFIFIAEVLVFFFCLVNWVSCIMCGMRNCQCSKWVSHNIVLQVLPLTTKVACCVLLVFKGKHSHSHSNLTVLVHLAFMHMIEPSC